mmetsp:Transcript_23087/g.72008  ORF Transcript_23087/g.72008 Transcript_23087/m.72008 type:complete len:417 (-) Transcript_23087:480-1730(-)
MGAGPHSLPPLLRARPSPSRVQNFGAICMFAFLGTFASTLLVGGIIWTAGAVGLVYRLPMLESLLFGSLISATDPVTVLAVFQELGADKNLYALVFGESVLNDAVAIVLYNSLLVFRSEPVTFATCLGAVWSFVVIFAGSLAVGTLVACLSALMFKGGNFKEHDRGSGHGAVVEVCLLLMFPYVSYMLAEGLQLSGIVSVLFCGIIMAHYTVENLTDEAQATSQGFFKVLAHLAETFVFIYMGADTFLARQSWRHVVFTIVTVIACLVARLANVYPNAYLINAARTRMGSPPIPRNHQHLLWVSGLRGAIAFALALGTADDLPNQEHARTMLTATTSVVLLTVLGIGGGTSTLLEKYKGRETDGMSCPSPVRPAYNTAAAEDGTPMAQARLSGSEGDSPDNVSSPRLGGRTFGFRV